MDEHGSQQRAISYLRVSTNEQAVSGLGIQAQRASIDSHLRHNEWHHTREIIDDGVSGTTPVANRRELCAALRHLDEGSADVLVVARLDRLSRSMSDFARLAQRAIDHRWAIVALDIGVDTTSPSGELVANMMAAVAQHEARLVSQRTSAALRMLKESGERLGRPVELDQTVRERVRTLHGSGLSLRAICAQLDLEGAQTARGGRWWPSTVRAVIRSLELDQEARTLAS